jgi:hypothetical protein
LRIPASFNQRHMAYMSALIHHQGPSWSWSYDSLIYNYLCNRCLLPLTLWVRILLRWGILDTTGCDKVCQWIAVGRWFSLGNAVSSNNKTDYHDITEILLKVALNTITLDSPPSIIKCPDVRIREEIVN